MPAFAYRAATADGAALHGVEQAATAAALERALAARGLFPLEVRPAEERAAPRRGMLVSRRQDVTGALRYLATLLGAGFPLDRALAAVTRVAARRDVAGALAVVRERVRAGAPLADALAEHPRIFPRLAVGMTRAGERGGHLAQALERLATQLEREQALRSRIATALTYPAVLAVAGALVLAVLCGYVLPRFVELLAEAGAALPRSTALLLAAADAVRRGWAVALGAGLALGAAAASMVRTDAGRRRVHELALRAPVLGPLRACAAAVRFARALGTLLGTGMPVLGALEIAASGLADEAVAAEVMRAREEVRAGGRLAEALGRGRAFPPLLLQMMEVGEEGGRLPEMLERAAAALEHELERRLDRLVRLAEPVMILVLGGAIGFVALSLLQAVYGVRMDALQ
jgi:type II secretory pathway component PulF